MKDTSPVDAVRRQVSAVRPADCAELVDGDFGEPSGVFERLEDRPEQLRMAFAVADALNQHRIALIEAGTGFWGETSYKKPDPQYDPDSDYSGTLSIGAAVAWHQDGTTHWESERWDPGIHGVNFMAQLCRTTPANGLWVVPGSHQAGHVDIPALVVGADVVGFSHFF